MSKVTIENCEREISCDASWDEMQLTNDPSIRSCQQCQKDVYLCKTDKELEVAVNLKRCAAINKTDISSENMMVGLWIPTDLIKK